MIHLLTFENYTSTPISKGEEIQNEKEHGTGSLMDKAIDKEITEEEKEELKEEDEKIPKKNKTKKKSDI